jgi:hypothetical protein
VTDDAVAVRRSRSAGPAKAMARRRTQAIGDGNDTGSNFAGSRDDGRRPIGTRSDVMGFGVRAELDLRMVDERVGKLPIEGEAPDSEASWLAVMCGKWHRGGWLAGKPKLDSVERGRSARYDSILEAQLAQGGPAARHQPFAARLVARKNVLVEDDDPMSTSGGKERSGSSRRPSADNRDIGVGGLCEAETVDRPWFDLLLELGLFRFDGGLGRDGHLGWGLTLGATGQS